LVGTKSKQDEYLAKAAEADGLAAKAAEGILRANWTDIADGYRELASQCAASAKREEAGS
jgi:hypothetical protein